MHRMDNLDPDPLDPRVQLIQALSAEERERQPDPADWLRQHRMADFDALAASQAGTRIDVNEQQEVEAWTRALGVTEEALRKAVAAVGDEADAVREHLGKAGA
jgi:hypothetical protein